MARSFPMTALVMVSCAALSLAGCNKSADMGNTVAGGNAMSAEAGNAALPALPQAVPLQSGPATPIALAPPVGALPARRQVALGRPADPRAAYAYLDRAYGVADALGDAPPDYSYDDGDVRPWVWQTAGGDAQYAEPVDGGYRYYYYQPGADQPYLVRDPDYSYAFAGAALVAVYAASGALVPYDAYGPRRDFAARYFWRGQSLREAAAQREHQGVIAANWAARRADLYAARATWAADRARQADWIAYHDAHQAEEQAHWAQEREQRQLAAQRFTGWQQTGFRDPQYGDHGADFGRRAATGERPPQDDLDRQRNLIAAQQGAAQAASWRDRQQATQRLQFAERQQAGQQAARVQAQARQNAEQQHDRIEQQQARQIEANRQAERLQFAEQRQERDDRQRQVAQAAKNDQAHAERQLAYRQAVREPGEAQPRPNARQRDERSDRPRQAPQAIRQSEPHPHAEQAPGQHQQQPEHRLAQAHAAPPSPPHEMRAPPPEHHEAPRPAGGDRDPGRHR